MERTDWDSYYRRPAATAQVTRRFTQRLLIRTFRRAIRPSSPGISICELGGANSCFADALVESLPVASYHIIDSNQFGISLLEKKYGSNGVVSWECADVMDAVNPQRLFDIVYSVGLIEHFDIERTAIAVSRHFELVKPAGIVVITFPTPTWLYRVSRGSIEAVRQWQFPDERPLGFEEVRNAISPHGKIVREFINWPIILTQGVVVARHA